MKFKRYIKNVFSIAGLEWRKSENVDVDKDGIIMSRRKTTTDTDRRIVADEQYLINTKNFVEEVLVPRIPNDSIIFQSEFLPAEPSDFKVGNVPEETPASDLNGLSTVELFDDIFFTDWPTITTPLKVVLKQEPDNIIEIGETVNFDVSANLTQGTINSTIMPLSAPVPVIGPATQYIFTDYDGGETVIAATSNTQVFVGDPFIAISGSMSMTTRISWSQGVGNYFNQKGRQVTCYEHLRVAGSQEITTLVQGSYKYFAGYGAAASAPIDSAGVRALTDFGFIPGDQESFVINLPAGQAEMYFYIPEGKIVEVLNAKQEFGYVTSDFTVSPIVVNDAGANPVNYESWVLPIGGVGFLEEQQYIISIQNA